LFNVIAVAFSTFFYIYTGIQQRPTIDA
jgi:hypothetical protein